MRADETAFRPRCRKSSFARLQMKKSLEADEAAISIRDTRSRAAEARGTASVRGRRRRAEIRRELHKQDGHSCGSTADPVLSSRGVWAQTSHRFRDCVQHSEEQPGTTFGEMALPVVSLRQGSTDEFTPYGVSWTVFEITSSPRFSS
ncbi:hypothetical protein WMY93_010334 [Mugilogobius chulae]|uniref:Uncharacterized protein n=1 Tax=Mugilogobius chulae TaxID=88201 RepID=A0AAW0P751_9GOBI